MEDFVTLDLHAGDMEWVQPVVDGDYFLPRKAGAYTRSR
jgi:hypothetical protein